MFYAPIFRHCQWHISLFLTRASFIGAGLLTLWAFQTSEGRGFHDTGIGPVLALICLLVVSGCATSRRLRNMASNPRGAMLRSIVIDPLAEELFLRLEQTEDKSERSPVRGETDLLLGVCHHTTVSQQ